MVKIKKKVVFLVPSLEGGGAERVFLNLCRNISKDKYSVTLCLLKKHGAYLDFLDEADFEIHDLGVSRVRFSIFPIVQYLHRNRPDILVSTLGHLNALLGVLIPFLPKATKLVARESNIVSKKEYGPLVRFLYRHYYKNFHKIIVQSDDMHNDLTKVANNLKPAQVIKINNPIHIEDITKAPETVINVLPVGKINLLSVGSLTYQKGYDILLNSFAEFKGIENYHLTIVGKGELERQLKKIALDLNITDYVTFAGFKSNPYPFMKQASVFVSSSRFEGFPNVVIESLACNTPVVANNYLGGINEIINNPIYGKIINLGKSDIFQQTCDEIVNRNIPPNILRRSIVQRFGIGEILSEYEELFDTL